LSLPISTTFFFHQHQVQDLTPDCLITIQTCHSHEIQGYPLCMCQKMQLH